MFPLVVCDRYLFRSEVPTRKGQIHGLNRGNIRGNGEYNLVVKGAQGCHRGHGLACDVWGVGRSLRESVFAEP